MNVVAVVIFYLFLNFVSAQQQHNRVGYMTTFAGIGDQNNGDGGNVAFARISRPGTMVFDNDLMYIAEEMNHRVRIVDLKTKQITTFIGTGKASFEGDNGLAQHATLNGPSGLALDLEHDLLYIADAKNHRIRVVNRRTNVITTFAGNGRGMYNGDNMDARLASLFTPQSVILDAKRNLVYIADKDNQRVRVVHRTSMIIQTVAGNGTLGYNGDNIPATSAMLFSPIGVTLDEPNQHLYICDRDNNRVRIVNVATNMITKFAGDGRYISAGDGGLASLASLAAPYAVAIDNVQNLVFIADTDNMRIRVVNRATNIISPFAGTGLSSFIVEGNHALNYSLRYPCAITLEKNYLYIADTLNHGIVVVDRATNIAETMIGKILEFVFATTSILRFPFAVFLDPVQDSIYIADAYNNRIRVVDRSSGIISTFAGTGLNKFAGDGNDSRLASLNRPFSVCVDDNSTVMYISDTDNMRIRAVNMSTKVIQTIAGNGSLGYSGDGGNARFATFRNATGITLDSLNKLLYIADGQNHVVRMINLTTNIITTVAGNGIQGYSGDDGPALKATFNRPFALALDESNTILYIADADNNRVRKLNLTSGIVSLYAGTGRRAYSGDGLDPRLAAIGKPYGLAIDKKRKLMYIADASVSSTIRVINQTSYIITTFAGNGFASFAGDGMLATSASLKFPAGVTIDSENNLLYVADTSNDRVRVISGIICNQGAAGEHCNYCEKGYFADQHGMSQCNACAVGTFSTVVGSTSSVACLSCAAGTISNIAAASSPSMCTPCSAGTFGKNGSYCAPCEKNFFSTAGASKCQLCENGT